MITKESLQEFLEKVIDENNTPSTCVVITDHGHTMVAAAGYSNLEHKTPVCENTVFAIGSASKAFGAAALCILVDDGKLDLDEPIKTYIPELQLYDDHTTKTLTARDLLCHRSGVPSHDAALFLAEPGISSAALLQQMQYLKPFAPARSAMHYNNHMYMLASYLSERISQMPWESFITTRILKPLGMNSTFFTLNEMQSCPNAAVGYHYDREERTFKPMAYADVHAAATAACLYSSPKDMAKWIELHINAGEFDGKQIVSQKMMTECHRPQITMQRGEGFVDMSLAEVDFESYGLGWFIESYKGRKVVYHGGKIDGFQVMQCFVPGTGFGFSISTNANITSVTSILQYALLDLYFEGGTTDWNEFFKGKYQLVFEKLDCLVAQTNNEAPKDTKTTHNLQEYAGTYVNKGYGKLEVFVENNKISGAFNTHSITLDHYGYDTFLTGFQEINIFLYPLTFQLSVTGKIESLAVDFEPSCGEKIVFLKQQDQALKASR